MRIRVVDEHFGMKEVELTLIQRLKLRVFGSLFLFKAAKEGWRGKLPFYLAKCRKHSIFFIDYPHGYDEALICPLCYEYLEKRRRK